MSTVLQVAMREIRERGKSKTYLLTTVLTLLLVVGLVVVPQLVGGPDEHAVGVVGEGNQQIIDAALEVGTANDEPDEEPSVVIEAVEFSNREDALAGLEEGEVDAVLIDGTEVVVETVGFSGSTLLALLQRGAAAVELERLVAEGGQTAVEVIDVMTSDPLTTTTLSGDDPDDPSRGLVAYAGLMLLYLAVLVYGTWILSGVTEEKSNRVVEVLLSAVRPWELLAGKIVGIGALGMTQFILTVVTGVVALRISGAIEIPAAGPGTIANLVLWFILGFVLYAVMFGAAGSLASRPEDAQNVAFPMSMIAVIGLFVSFAALESPEGTAAVVGTFIPLTAPFVVPVRVALDAIPAWQYILAVVITMASIVGMVFVAGRIYSGGLLQFGARVGLRNAWKSAAN
jgi:ABC-2 type transport system permease protein